MQDGLEDCLGIQGDDREYQRSQTLTPDAKPVNSCVINTRPQRAPKQRTPGKLQKTKLCCASREQRRRMLVLRINKAERADEEGEKWRRRRRKKGRK